MADKDNERLKHCLKKTALPQPRQQFTEEVMREIEAMNADAVFIKPETSALLKDTKLTSPSAAFTFRVMNQVRALESQPIDKTPVINLRSWMVTGIFFLALVIFALIPQKETASDGSTYFMSMGAYLTHAFTKYSEIVFYGGTVMLAVVLLLVLDRWLSRVVVRRG